MLAAATLTVAVVLLESVLLRSSVSIVDAVTSVTGILYIGFPFAYMVMLREWPDTRMITTQLGNFEFGCALIWIMFIGTWASDTFAYFTGSAIGRHKLCPSISPNKTIEGFLGSLAGTTAAVAGLGIFFGLPVQEMAILGLLIAVLATLGDLVESVAKRYAGIKDSGNLIPGHGGIWDRFDSVLFTAPLVYYFVKFVGLAMK
jgi:phosphatidate cytidylyltransferase